MPRVERPPRPLPPPPAPDLKRCVYGGAAHARGWRWLPALGRWERVCPSHYTTTQLRHGLYVPDIMTTPRQESSPT